MMPLILKLFMTLCALGLRCATELDDCSLQIADDVNDLTAMLQVDMQVRLEARRGQRSHNAVSSTDQQLNKRSSSEHDIVVDVNDSAQYAPYPVEGQNLTTSRVTSDEKSHASPTILSSALSKMFDYGHSLSHSSSLAWVCPAVLLAFLGWFIAENVRYYRVRIRSEDPSKGRQIGSYDANQVTDVGTLLRLFAKGSLCANVKVWKQVGGYLLLWTCATGVILVSFKDPANVDCTPIKNLSTYLNGFMPFFFAMYLNVVFNRWWTIRTAGLGAMWQTVDDLCVMLATYCPGKHMEDKRNAMLRYGLLCQALMYQTGRNNPDLKQLVEDGLLAGSELQILQETAGSKPQCIWVWILDLWTSLRAEKHIEEFVMIQAQKLVIEGRRAVKVAFTYITCQVPYGWVHLMTCMVNLSVAVLVIKTSLTSTREITLLSKFCFSGQGGVRNDQCNFNAQVLSLVCEFAHMAIMPFLFLAFLEFTNELSNPFGIDPHDFPRLAYMDAMRKENQAFFDVAGKGAGGACKLHKDSLPHASPAEVIRTPRGTS